IMGWKDVANSLKEKTLNHKEQTREPFTISFTKNSSDVNTVIQNLLKWRSDLNRLDDSENQIKIDKINHFLELRKYYIDLFLIATSEPPNEYAKFGIRYKKERHIPLGKNVNQKSLREWIGYQVCTSLSISQKTENRYFNSLGLISGLLNEFTVESLVQANATLEFFIKLKSSNRIPFYQTCKGVKNIKFGSIFQMNLNEVENESDEESDEVEIGNDESDDDG
ncbi:9595_t:CDS:1, partial [Racocetra fulgida]